VGHAKSRFENAICSISLFENQAFRSSFCIRTKKISERRDCLFALPVNKKEVINQKNTFLFEFCSRSTLFGCCLFALPVEGKAVEMLKTRVFDFLAFSYYYFLQNQKSQKTNNYKFLVREREKGNAGTNFPKSSELTFPSAGGQKGKNGSRQNRPKNVSFWGQIRISFYDRDGVFAKHL
jgi:beta-glucosidase/6-phospho-beta-glucosidase/beta-galactosidase